MKYPISFLLLLIMLIPMSCGVNQNEVTLDKLVGKWQLVSSSVKYNNENDDYSEYYSSVTSNTQYTYITISKISGNRGLWKRETTDIDNPNLNEKYESELFVRGQVLEVEGYKWDMTFTEKRLLLERCDGKSLIGWGGEGNCWKNKYFLRD